MHGLINAPLLWMLHSRCNNNKIRHLHKRCLRLIYCNKNSSYEELLEKDRSASIHHRDVQNLAIKMYKVKKELALMITANVFTTIPENYYNLIMVLDYLLQEQFTMALKASCV